METAFDQVAKLLIYDGPDLHELISDVVRQGNEFDVQVQNGISQIFIHSSYAYNLQVTDVYSYSTEGQLIKQVVIIQGKEKVVFDKYKEVSGLLASLDESLNSPLVS